MESVVSNEDSVMTEEEMFVFDRKEVLSNREIFFSHTLVSGKTLKVKIR